MSQAYAEHVARRFAALEEGIFCGISAAAVFEATMKLSREIEKAVMAFVVYERYLSMACFRHKDDANEIKYLKALPEVLNMITIKSYVKFSAPLFRSNAGAYLTGF